MMPMVASDGAHYRRQREAKGSGQVTDSSSPSPPNAKENQRGKPLRPPPIRPRGAPVVPKQLKLVNSPSPASAKKGGY